MDNRKVGRFIAALRKKRGWTQQQLADRIHIGREAVSKWERGLNIPDSVALLKVSQIFEISINELLTGEYINEDNKETVETAAIQVMSESEKKIKRMKLILLGVSIFFVFLFLLYYFLVNYNSFKVYLVNIDGNTLKMDQGILFSSRQKTYIKLGNIKYQVDKKLSHFEIYCKNGDYVETYASGDNLVNTSFITYNISRNFSNLYLDIYYDDSETETIPIRLFLDYSNSSLFPSDKNDIKPKTMDDIVLSEIPTFIRENFTMEKDKYVYEFEEDGVKYNATYDYALKILNIYVYSHKFYFFYNLEDDFIDIVDNNTIRYYYDTKTCSISDCNQYMQYINDIYNRIIGKIRT